MGLDIIAISIIMFESTNNIGQIDHRVIMGKMSTKRSQSSLNLMILLILFYNVLWALCSSSSVGGAGGGAGGSGGAGWGTVVDASSIITSTVLPSTTSSSTTTMTTTSVTTISTNPSKRNQFGGGASVASGAAGGATIPPPVNEYENDYDDDAAAMSDADDLDDDDDDEEDDDSTIDYREEAAVAYEPKRIASASTNRHHHHQHHHPSHLIDSSNSLLMMNNDHLGVNSGKQQQQHHLAAALGNNNQDDENDEDNFCKDTFIDSAYYNGYDTILTRGDRLWYYYKDRHRLSRAFDQRRFTQGDHIQGAFNISRTPYYCLNRRTRSDHHHHQHHHNAPHHHATSPSAASSSAASTATFSMNTSPVSATSATTTDMPRTIKRTQSSAVNKRQIDVSSATVPPTAATNSDCVELQKLRSTAVYFLHNKQRTRSYYNLDVRHPNGTQRRVRSRDLPWNMKQVGLLGGNLWPNGWEIYQKFRPVAFLPSRYEMIFIMNHYHHHHNHHQHYNLDQRQQRQPDQDDDDHHHLIITPSPILTWNNLDSNNWNTSWRSKILKFDPPVIFTGMFEMNGIVYAVGEEMTSYRSRSGQSSPKRVGKMFRYYATDNDDRELRQLNQTVQEFFGCPKAKIPSSSSSTSTSSHSSSNKPSKTEDPIGPDLVTTTEISPPTSSSSSSSSSATRSSTVEKRMSAPPTTPTTTTTTTTTTPRSKSTKFTTSSPTTTTTTTPTTTTTNTPTTTTMPTSTVEMDSTDAPSSTSSSASSSSSDSKVPVILESNDIDIDSSMTKINKKPVGTSSSGTGVKPSVFLRNSRAKITSIPSPNAVRNQHNQNQQNNPNQLNLAGGLNSQQSGQFHSSASSSTATGLGSPSSYLHPKLASSPYPTVTLRETDSIMLTILIAIVIGASVLCIVLACLVINGKKRHIPPQFEGGHRIEPTIPKPSIIGLDYHRRKNSTSSSLTPFNFLNRYDSMNSLSAIYSQVNHHHNNNHHRNSRLSPMTEPCPSPNLHALHPTQSLASHLSPPPPPPPPPMPTLSTSTSRPGTGLGDYSSSNKILIGQSGPGPGPMLHNKAVSVNFNNGKNNRSSATAAGTTTTATSNSVPNLAIEVARANQHLGMDSPTPNLYPQQQQQHQQQQQQSRQHHHHSSYLHHHPSESELDQQRESNNNRIKSFERFENLI